MCACGSHACAAAHTPFFSFSPPRFFSDCFGDDGGEGEGDGDDDDDDHLHPVQFHQFHRQSSQRTPLTQSPPAHFYHFRFVFIHFYCFFFYFIFYSHFNSFLLLYFNTFSALYFNKFSVSHFPYNFVSYFLGLNHCQQILFPLLFLPHSEHSDCTLSERVLIEV